MKNVLNITPNVHGKNENSRLNGLFYQKVYNFLNYYFFFQNFFLVAMASAEVVSDSDTIFD